MGTAIKHPGPDRVKPSFVIFDIRALWHSGLSVRVFYSCSHMAAVGHQRVNYSIAVDVSCMNLQHSRNIATTARLHLHHAVEVDVGENLNSTRRPPSDRRPWADDSRSRSEAVNSSEWLLSADVWNWHRKRSFVSERGESWLAAVLTA